MLMLQLVLPLCRWANCTHLLMQVCESLCALTLLYTMHFNIVCWTVHCIVLYHCMMHSKLCSVYSLSLKLGKYIHTLACLIPIELCFTKI